MVDVSEERPNHVWKYQHYYLQHMATTAAVKQNPWALIPMFHNDPRRWCKPSGGDFDKKLWKFGPWDEPFKYIATIKNTDVFIGFKMDTPLGYKPLDPRLPNLMNFYNKCAIQGQETPILSHCSSGGVMTHEAIYYRQYDNKTIGASPKDGHDRILSYNPDSSLGYFYDEYVHPKSW